MALTVLFVRLRNSLTGDQNDQKDNKPELPLNLLADSRPPSSSQSVSITQQRRSEGEKKPRWVWSTALQRATTAHWINMSFYLVINSLS